PGCFLLSHFQDFLSSALFLTGSAWTAPPTLSLHDALPIFKPAGNGHAATLQNLKCGVPLVDMPHRRHQTKQFECANTANAEYDLDRKSTRLNSSHVKNLVCRLLLEKKKTPKQKLPAHKHHV